MTRLPELSAQKEQLGSIGFWQGHMPSSFAGPLRGCWFVIMPLTSRKLHLRTLLRGGADVCDPHTPRRLNRSRPVKDLPAMSPQSPFQPEEFGGAADGGGHLVVCSALRDIA